MTIIYITKYALTDGIQERELVDINGGVCTVKWPGGLNGVFYLHGNDWHMDKPSAILRAETIRDKKVAALRKKIGTLERMKFDSLDTDEKG